MADPSATDTDTEVEFETRAVRVDDPALSERTNQRLTEQLQEVVGAQTVRVPKDRPHPSRGEAGEVPTPAFATNGWLMLVIGAFAALVIGGIVATGVTGSGWFVALAIVIDIVGVIVVATVVIRMTSITERANPTLVAAMEEEGVANPDERFTQMVDEFRRSDIGEDEHRNTAVEDDHGTAAAEQRSAMTPTGGTSRAVGP